MKLKKLLKRINNQDIVTVYIDYANSPVYYMCKPLDILTEYKDEKAMLNGEVLKIDTKYDADIGAVILYIKIRRYLYVK